MTVTKQFRQKISELMRARLELDQSASEAPMPGYMKNWLGMYVPSKLFTQVSELYEDCIKQAPDESEARALRFSYAALLRDGLLLDEAATICEASIAAAPEAAYGDQHLLAFIEARRGNLPRAKELASQVNSNPRAKSFFVQEADLLREFEASK